MKKLLLLFSLTLLAQLTIQAQINDGSLPKSFVPAFHLSQNIPLFEMPALDMDAIEKEDAERDAKGVLMFCGRNQPTFINPSLHGVWDRYPGGDQIWRTRIQSNDAQGITLYFSDFKIPQGAKLYVYSLDKKQVLGGFTSENNQESGKMALGPIYTDDIIVEYFEPATVAGLGKFTIDEVGHMYRFANLYKTTEDFGDSESCQVNVNCSPEGTGKTQQRDATARILVKVGASQGWCTGSMVNNALQNCTRYFLTALHCGLSGGGALASTADFNQWVFYFNFQAAGCTNPSSQGTLANQSLTGAVWRAHSNDGGGDTGSDFLLLELNTAIPPAYNVFFAGWNNVNTGSTGGYSIHHPAGDIKKISTYTSTLASTSWGGTVANTHWQVTWAATTNGHGVTEGGSSGSPIFNASGQIVGTLTGGGSFCTSPTSPDAYGKMSYHWASNGTVANRRLRDWLDPNNTGITSLAGTYFPCTPAVALDAGIESITNPADGSTICDNPFAPVVVLKNFGTTTLTSVTINYRINALTPATYSWTGSLATNASTSVTLPLVTVPVGAGVPFTFNAYTSAPNAGTDANASNDGITVNTELRSSSTIPYSEAFNAATLPTNIDVYNPDADGFDWEHNTAASAYGTGTGSIRFDNFNGTSGSNPGGTLDWFFLPPMSFAGKTDVGMSFDVAYRRYNTSTNDSLIVAINTDCGTTYSVIYLKGGATLASVATASTTAFTPTSTQWRHDSIDLSAFDGEPNVVIAFINKSDWGQFLYVDNINVAAGSACVMTSSISSSNNVSCNGGTNGSATVTPATGTPTYSYLWSNGRTTAANTGLAAGTYIVTVTDANGCIATSNVTITQPAALTASISSSSNVLCNGGSTGSATANGTGGTGSKTYLWSNGRTTAANTGLIAGTYTVTVTDANGCLATSSTTITQPATAVAASIASSTNVLCNGGSTGSATANGTGGTGTISYAWSNGRTTAANTGLIAGTYTVTVTDANGCVATSSVNITQPATAVAASIAASTNVLCNGGSTGSATANGTGGTGTISYAWSNGRTTASNTGLAAGTYIVSVTDANGCRSTSSVNITQPTAVSGAINDHGDGTATASGSGGTPTYAYQWGATAGNQTTATATGLIHNNTYTVTITDANGCTSTANVTVNIVGVTEIPSLTAFEVIPNPNTGNFQIQISFNEVKEAHVNITNVLGQTLQEYHFAEQVLNIPVDIQQQASGVYFVVLRTDDKITTKKVTIAK